MKQQENMLTNLCYPLISFVRDSMLFNVSLSIEINIRKKYDTQNKKNLMSYQLDMYQIRICQKYSRTHDFYSDAKYTLSGYCIRSIGF